VTEKEYVLENPPKSNNVKEEINANLQPQAVPCPPVAEISEDSSIEILDTIIEKSPLQKPV